MTEYFVPVALAVVGIVIAALFGRKGWRLAGLFIVGGAASAGVAWAIRRAERRGMARQHKLQTELAERTIEELERKDAKVDAEVRAAIEEIRQRKAARAEVDPRAISITRADVEAFLQGAGV